LRYGPPRWTEYILKNWSGQRTVIAIPVPLAAALLPDSVPHRPQDFVHGVPALGRPPYGPVFSWLEEGALDIKLRNGSYAYLFSEPLYVSSWLYSMEVAAVSTLLCLCVGYPWPMRSRARRPRSAMSS
jgi:putrescine transport system permease protein